MEKKRQRTIEEARREAWVDYVRLFACVFVVLGHFFQSMVKAAIIPETMLYISFDRVIYSFHVPLFFICSGYLYQRYTNIANRKMWIKNIKKKLLVLGIPYFIFATVTWVLKYVFSMFTNSQQTGWAKMIFLSPPSPYWYLYTLFFVFVMTPTVKKKRYFWLLFLVATVMKYFYVNTLETDIFLIDSLCKNEIWFVLGMGIALIDFERSVARVKSLVIGIVLGLIFGYSSYAVYEYMIWDRRILFAIGFVACLSIIMIIGYVSVHNKQPNVLATLAKYTMPVFLMHTIFAAAIRIVLIQLEIFSVTVHFILGILLSFIGPILVANVLSKMKYGDFVLYPGKYIN